MTHADLSKIVFSCIGTRDEEITDKGKSFEKRMMKNLRDWSFHPKTIQTTRGPNNDQFDYDVAFVWGDYAFFSNARTADFPTTAQLPFAITCILSANTSNRLLGYAKAWLTIRIF